MFRFYFLLLLSSVVASQDFGEKLPSPCGLYGFRCIDTKRAQFCDEKLETEEATSKPRIFECAKGLVCDEEKKEFCSPGEAKPKCATTDRILDKRSFRRYDDRVDEAFDFDSNKDATEVPKVTLDDDEDDDDSRGPTEEPEGDPWNGSPPVLCTSHGFHAGSLTLRFLWIFDNFHGSTHRRRRQVFVLLLRSQKERQGFHTQAHAMWAQPRFRGKLQSVCAQRNNSQHETWQRKPNTENHRHKAASELQLHNEKTGEVRRREWLPRLPHLPAA